MAALAALAACRTPAPLGDQLRADQLLASDGGVVNANTLGSGDIVEVRVYQEPDLTGAYRVSSEGIIDFPLCGRVQVKSMSANQAATVLTDCLKEKYLKRPAVTVLVKEFNSKKVFVFGEVAKPGAFAYEEGMTIVHAVSQAGGFNRTASKNSVNVTRVIDGKEMKIPVRVEDIVVGREKNIALLPGDIVFVPESIL